MDNLWSKAHSCSVIESAHATVATIDYVCSYFRYIRFCVHYGIFFNNSESFIIQENLSCLFTLNIPDADASGMIFINKFIILLNFKNKEVLLV